jgi:hypothetical protein
MIFLTAPNEHDQTILPSFLWVVNDAPSVCRHSCVIGWPSSQPKQQEHMEALIFALIATRTGYTQPLFGHRGYHQFDFAHPCRATRALPHLHEAGSGAPQPEPELSRA